MTRRKIEVALLENWEEVDRTLKELAEIEREEDIINLAMIEKIEGAKDEAADETAPLELRHKQLSSALEQFATHHKEEFEKAPRSRTLTFGKIGFRRSTGMFATVAKWSWKQVLEKLQELGKRKYIRIKEEVNKEALETDYRAQKITDSALEVMGLKWTVKDEFFYELPEEIPTGSHDGK